MRRKIGTFHSQVLETSILLENLFEGYYQLVVDIESSLTSIRELVFTYIRSNHESLLFGSI